ncbi:unnamed protein product [Ectocarpus sp. 4 AP-2014]
MGPATCCVTHTKSRRSPSRGPAMVWEFVRTPAFVWWVNKLRCADAVDALSYASSFVDGACCSSDELVDSVRAGGRNRPVVGGAGDGDGAGRTRDCGAGAGCGRDRDPFVFFACVKDEAERNLRWSCDYCTRKRKDCDGATSCERCRRLSLTCGRPLPARELRARPFPLVMVGKTFASGSKTRPRGSCPRGTAATKRRKGNAGAKKLARDGQRPPIGISRG